MQLSFICNRKPVSLTIPAGTPVLNIIRLDLGFTGCREGCKEGECGACTVLLGTPLKDRIEYMAVASCLLPAAELQGRHVVSIEGLYSDNKLNPLQQAFTDLHASQCGFCSPGFLISLSGFFFSSIDLSEEDAVTAIDGNICRCTGYTPIKRVIKSICLKYAPKLNIKRDRITQLIKWKIIPDYFSDIPEQLQKLKSITETENPLPLQRSKIISGGSDLFIQKNISLEADDDLVSLRNRLDLNEIHVNGNIIEVGGVVSVEAFRTNQEIAELIPSVKEDLSLVSSTILRNRASIAGNLVNASPIADLAVYLLPFNTVLTISNGKSERQIALEKFFIDYKQINLTENELINKISITIPDTMKFSFRKVARRKYLDIASVNSAVCFTKQGNQITSCRIAAGGVAPIPKVYPEAADIIKNRDFSADLLKKMLSSIKESSAPITDIRGSKEYKIRLLQHQIISHFHEVFPSIINIEEVIHEL